MDSVEDSIGVTLRRAVVKVVTQHRIGVYRHRAGRVEDVITLVLDAAGIGRAAGGAAAKPVAHEEESLANFIGTGVDLRP